MKVPKAIKTEVWRRAGGRCATCGKVGTFRLGVRVIGPQPATGVDVANLASICVECRREADKLNRARPSPALRRRVFARDAMVCQLCGRRCLSRDELYEDVGRPDRVLRRGADQMAEAGVLLLLPRAQGGTFDIANLVTSCRACWSSKGDRALDAYEAQKLDRQDWEETRL